MQENRSLQSRATWTKATRSANFHQIPSKSSTDTKKLALVYCTSSSMPVLSSGLATRISQSIHRSTWLQQTSIIKPVPLIRKLTKMMELLDQRWWNLSKFQGVLTISQVLLKKHLEMPLRHPLTTISTNKATMRSQLQTICKPKANNNSPRILQQTRLPIVTTIPYNYKLLFKRQLSISFLAKNALNQLIMRIKTTILPQKAEMSQDCTSWRKTCHWTLNSRWRLHRRVVFPKL